jgi:hypothetical protein
VVCTRFRDSSLNHEVKEAVSAGQIVIIARAVSPADQGFERRTRKQTTIGWTYFQTERRGQSVSLSVVTDQSYVL